MLASDRAQFDEQLALLCAGFNLPLGERSGAYWIGLAKMELATFARIVAHCLGEEGPDKMPTTRQCWAIAKHLRSARAPAPEPTQPQWRGDHWAIKANLLLLNRVRTYPKRYAPDSTYDASKRQAVPGPLTKLYTGIVVRWKNTWAEDMRTDRPNGAKQREAWEDCMGRADAECAAIDSRARCEVAA